MVTYFLSDSSNNGLNGEVRNAMIANRAITQNGNGYTPQQQQQTQSNGLPASLHTHPPEYYQKQSQFQDNSYQLNMNSDTYNIKKDNYGYNNIDTSQVLMKTSPNALHEEQQQLLMHQQQQVSQQQQQPYQHHLAQQQQQRLNSKLQKQPNFIANGGLPNIRENGHNGEHNGSIGSGSNGVGGYAYNGYPQTQQTQQQQQQYNNNYAHHQRSHSSSSMGGVGVMGVITMAASSSPALPTQQQVQMPVPVPVPAQANPSMVMLREQFNIIENPGGNRLEYINNDPYAQVENYNNLFANGVGVGVGGGGGVSVGGRRETHAARNYHHLHHNQQHSSSYSTNSNCNNYNNCRESEPLLHAAPVAKVSEYEYTWNEEILL